MEIVLRIAYDGTRFLGWQKTNSDPIEFPSIEYELECALERILQHPITLQAASRTDRGVHAVGQCVSFSTPKMITNLSTLSYGINAVLPPDIRIVDAFVSPYPDFHVTLSASHKEYHYKISYAKTLLPLLRFTHWHFPYALDFELMNKAASALVGTHDFKAFRNRRKEQKDSDTIRTLLSVIVVPTENECVLIKIKGTNFLYKMARNIAGTLAYIGSKKLPVASIHDLLQGAERKNSGITAPACGLTLYSVYYTTHQE